MAASSADGFAETLPAAPRTGFRTATGRSYAAVQRGGEPSRPATGVTPDLFDLTPTDDQRLIRDTVAEFATEQLREAAVVPGKPEKSYLIEQITPEGGKAAMPKDAPPLSDKEVATIRKWIELGAKDDTPASNRPQYDADHPPIYLAPPVLKSIEYSPKGDVLAIGGYHEVLLQKADGSGLVARLVGQSERIEAARFSPDSAASGAASASWQSSIRSSSPTWTRATASSRSWKTSPDSCAPIPTASRRRRRACSRSRSGWRCSSG